MNKILGLLDALESNILNSKKVPLSNKVIIDENEIVEIIDKIRLVLKSDLELIKQSSQSTEKCNDTNNNLELSEKRNQNDIAHKQIIEKELEKIKKLKNGADDYAQYVLSNLQLTVTKMQNNLLKLEKNIESGKQVISEKKELNKINSEDQHLKETTYG